MTAQLTFYGGTGTVTGANFLLELPECKLLVDCGLLQGNRFAEDFNRQAFPYDPSTIDFLFVTHAHMDHIGRIPKLVKEGFKGTIFSTAPTRELAAIMLADAYSILEREAQEEGILPLYDKGDIDRALSLWKDIPYHTVTEVKGGLSVHAKDAGHILGSALYEFTRPGVHSKKIVFTGDLGNSPALFLSDSEIVEDATYMVIESVYGDRNHESHDERRRKLTDTVRDTIERKRTLIIPTFSIERTQDILFELNDLIETGEVESLPVYLDSPLALKVTAIYRTYSSYFKKSARERIALGDDLFHFPKLTLVHNNQESSFVEKRNGPKIIIAGSGMSMGGRVVRHEERLLPRPDTTVLLVGYQVLGTLGRKLQDGAREVRIGRNIVRVNAEIRSITGYSSHKDSDHLLEFVSYSQKTLKQVFVAMGEPKSSLFLVQKLRDYADVDALYPKVGKVYELDF